MERKHYIDNLRWICIALLIPYHIAMAYNCWGESNYIFLHANKVLSSFVVMLSPWFMGLLFLLAGMSAKYSLKKRTRVQFLKQRTHKLLLPLLVGTLIFIPVLSFIADKTNMGYSDNFFEHYSVFFTRWTDLSGFDGGFTIGHLWFLLYLFVISLAVCLFDLVLGKYISKLNIANTNILLVIGFVLIATLCTPLKLGGKSILTFLLLYMLGYFIMSEDNIVDKLSKYKFIFLSLWVVVSVVNIWLFIWSNYELDILNTIISSISGCLGVLAFLTIGKSYLDRKNKLTKFLSSISFPIYITHFIWVVLFEYWFSNINNNTVFVVGLTLLCSTVATLISSAIIKYCPIINYLFGYNFKRKEKLKKNEETNYEC